jgi:hypothetical protein
MRVFAKLEICHGANHARWKAALELFVPGWSKRLIVRAIETVLVINQQKDLTELKTTEVFCFRPPFPPVQVLCLPASLR